MTVFLNRELSELPVATTSSSCAPQTAGKLNYLVLVECVCLFTPSDAVTVSAPQNDSPAPPSISSMVSYHLHKVRS